MSRTAQISLLAAPGLVALWLCGGCGGQGCTGCEGDDDSAADALLAEECRLLQYPSQGDFQGLRGCANPDCAVLPHCQVSWTSVTDAVYGSVRFRPPDDSISSLGNMFPALATPWRDLDGDGVEDTALSVGCLDFTSNGVCDPSTPMMVSQHLVSGQRLADEPYIADAPGDALFSELLQYDNPVIPVELVLNGCFGSTSMLDLDDDGHLDLVLAQPFAAPGPTIRLWWGDPGGVGLPRDADLASVMDRDCAATAVAGDLDGDGDEELTVINGVAAAGTVGLLLGGARPAALDGAALDVSISVGSTAPGTFQLLERAGDVVGDSRDDLVLVMRCGAAMQSGDFVHETCEWASEIMVAAFAGRDDWPATLTLDDADALFSVLIDHYSYPLVRHADTGDVNGDGRRDLVIAHWYGELDEVDERFKVSLHGLGVVLPGASGGWSTGSPPQPRWLLPGAISQEGFGRLVLVTDLDGDGVDEVVVGDGKGEVYAPIAEHHDLPYGDESDLRVLYHVFRGGPDIVGDPGTWVFPSHIVYEGEELLPGFTGVVPYLSTYNTSLAIGPDLDGDGLGEWMHHHVAFAPWHTQFTPDDRTVIEVLSGEALLDGF